MQLIFLIMIIAFCLTAYGQTTTNNETSKSVDTIPVLTRDQKMDTAFFWKMMDYAFSRARFDYKLREQAILDQLIKLTPEQIQEFSARSGSCP